jgi:hypothetical protein
MYKHKPGKRLASNPGYVKLHNEPVGTAFVPGTALAIGRNTSEVRLMMYGNES